MSDRDSICASTENPRHRYPTTHGEFGTRLHKVWDGMKQRCLVSRLTLGKRIKAGWEPEQAMTFIEPRSEFAKRRKRSARGEFA